MRKGTSTLLATLLLALSATFTTYSLAQKPGSLEPRTDSDRAKVSTLIEKGDTSSAQKLMLEFQPPSEIIPLPNLKYNVQYEEIKACGFYPQETRLECVLDIKRTNGYAGPIGSPGSIENVLFCVDWNGDGFFDSSESVGEGSVAMHDESAGAQPTWQYAVYRDFDPRGGVRTSNTGNTTTTVTNGPTRRARAILSWFVESPNCNTAPIWGNVFDFRMRFDPIR
jgi:hypothetical protein